MAEWPPIRLLAAAAAVLGGMLIAAGLILGFTKVHASNVEGDCGSVFGGANSAYYGAFGPSGDQCAGPISDRRTLTWVVIVPGVIALISASMLEGRYRVARDQEATRSTP